MSVVYDWDMTKYIYHSLSRSIRDLEEKKKTALEMNSPVGFMIAERINTKIMEKKEALKRIKFTLEDMTKL